MLSEKQIFNRLDKYYKKVYGDSDFDEWYTNPAVNVWKFIREGKTITLICNIRTGEIEATER